MPPADNKQKGPPSARSRKRRLSRKRKPEHLTIDEWQVALRRQFGREQDFELKNTGGHPVFSEFAVTNPVSGRTYRVAIRGEALGVNYCSCPDFAVNTLGTCKHVEFTLSRLGKTTRTRALLRQGYAPPYSEVYLRYGPQRRVVFSAGTEATPALHRLASQYFGTDGFLRKAAFGRFDRFIKRLRRFKHEVRCYDDALAYIADVRDARYRRSVIQRQYTNGDRRLAKVVKADLYPYQREGVLFAARTGRALLADDMGLGKTVQAIAAAEIMAREFGVERVLIVCPASLKHQWKGEIERFCDRSAVVIEGAVPDRRARYRGEGFFKIVNYELVHRDLDSIRAWAPDLVVLDEAQRIKNWKTRTARTVKRLDSTYAFVLTGTPLENRLEELHSIVEFIDRHRLGPLFRFLAEHQTLDPETGRVISYRNLKNVGETLRPILLRRTRNEVLRQLPDRMDKHFFVPMTEQQWELHQEYANVVARIAAKWRRLGFLSERDQHILMTSLQRMRMACNNTYLVDHETRFGPKLDELAVLLAEILERPETKVVVFSQWKRMQDLVAERLKERGVGFVFLHGGVPSPRRKDLVKTFRQDNGAPVFLSTDAGGTGLNLQRASTVINLDLPWNPAVLEQRIGRVHRIGQHEKVRVVNFVSEGTIEHGMLKVLAFKKAIFAGVLDRGEDTVFLGESRLNKFMKDVETLTGAVPPSAHEAPTPPTADEAEVGDDDVPEHPAEQPAAAPFQPLIEAGTAFLRELTGALAESRKTGTSPLAGLVERDAATGRSYLKLPLPDPDLLTQAAEGLAPLLDRWVGSKE